MMIGSKDSTTRKKQGLHVSLPALRLLVNLHDHKQCVYQGSISLDVHGRDSSLGGWVPVAPAEKKANNDAAASQPSEEDHADWIAQFKEQLLNESRETTACLEAIWAKVLTAAQALVQLSKDVAGVTGCGDDVPDAAGNELVQRVHVVFQDLDNLGVSVASAQHDLDHVAALLADSALSYDMANAREADVSCGDAQGLHKSYVEHIQAVLASGLHPDAVVLGLSDCYVHARKLLKRLATALNTVATKLSASSSSVNSAGQGLSSERPSVLAENGGGATNHSTGNGSSSSSRVSSGDGTWRPPDQFRRSTTKFWVRLEDVPRLRVAILRHLPLLVIGRQEGKLIQDLKAGDLPGSASLRERCRQQEGIQDHSASSAISSIYFDSPQHGTAQQGISDALGVVHEPPVRLWPFAKHEPIEAAVLRCPLPVYHSRLRRHDGSSLVRVRWYGPDPALEDNAHVFLERKLHRDAWTGEFSMKERAKLPLTSVPPFLSGCVIPDMENQSSGDIDVSREGTRKLLHEVQKLLIDLEQEPVLRTSYRRSAFQRSDTNAVRISLDTQVVMRKEFRKHDDLPWSKLSTHSVDPGNALCAGDGVSAASDQAVHFPYAILEIKLQNGDSCPDWVLACRQSGLLVEVPKFSKFLHGMALLYPRAVRNTPTWFTPKYTTYSASVPPPNTLVPATPHGDVVASLEQQGPDQTEGIMLIVSGESDVDVSGNAGSGGASASCSSGSITTATDQDGCDSAKSDPTPAMHDVMGDEIPAASSHVRSISASDLHHADSDHADQHDVNALSRCDALRRIDVSGFKTDQFSSDPDDASTKQGCWSAMKGGLISAMTSKDLTASDASACSGGSVKGCYYMVPANIDEVERDDEDANKEVPGWLFPNDITPEQWFDAQATHNLPPAFNSGDTVCTACNAQRGAASATTDHMEAVQHTCAMSALWKHAAVWKVPDQPCSGISSPCMPPYTPFQISCDEITPALEIKAGVDTAGSVDDDEITLRPHVPYGEISCSTPTLKPTTSNASACSSCWSDDTAFRSNTLSDFSACDNTDTFSAASSSSGSSPHKNTCEAVQGFGFARSSNHPLSWLKSKVGSVFSNTRVAGYRHHPVATLPDYSKASTSSCAKQYNISKQFKQCNMPATASSYLVQSAAAAPSTKDSTHHTPPPSVGNLSISPQISSVPRDHPLHVVLSGVSGRSGSGTLRVPMPVPAIKSPGNAKLYRSTSLDTRASASNGHAKNSGIYRTVSVDSRAAGYVGPGSGSVGVLGRAGRKLKGIFKKRRDSGCGSDVDPENPKLALPAAGTMVRTRIEPKTFFAAERTFLSWLNLSVMLMFVALSLLATAITLARRANTAVLEAQPAFVTVGANSQAQGGTGPQPSVTPMNGVAVSVGPSGMSSGLLAAAGLHSMPAAGGGAIMAPGSAVLPGSDFLGICGPGNPACKAGLLSGVIVAPIAILFMCYALFMYRKRTAQILRRETVRYDDQRGPVMLVLLLILVLGVAYGLTVKMVIL